MGSEISREKKIAIGITATVATVAGAVYFFGSKKANAEDEKLLTSKFHEQKQLHFLKQGESSHNVRAYGQKNNEIRDPQLTPKGLKQAKSCTIPDILTSAQSNNILILCSPLRRCIKTVIAAFGDFCRFRYIKIKVLSMLQGGRGDQQCLLASTLEELRKFFKNDLDILDFSDLETNHGHLDDEQRADRVKVMTKIRAFISSKPHEHVLISAHTYVLTGISNLKKLKLKYARLQTYDFDVQTQKVKKQE